MHTRALALCAALAFSTPQLALADDLRLVSFNVESGGAVPEVVASQIARLHGVDVWVLSEVRNSSWATSFETAAERGEGTKAADAHFDSVLGTTGRADRLQIIFDEDKFTLVSSNELAQTNPTGNHRASLVAHLRHKESSQEVLVVANHLARGNATLRRNQATLLNQWATTQTVPIVAAGDFNFDWEVRGGDNDHDQGFDNLVANDVFAWVRPRNLVKTQCSESFDSVLDFVFVAGAAKQWAQSSQILFPALDYCHLHNSSSLVNATQSDHRPVSATFDW